MATVTLARNAMATRFELVLHGARESALRAAGEEALAEVERLENQLSLYRPQSEIAQLNARAAHEPVLVSPEVFALLQRAQQLHHVTAGAFDITIGPLVRCWGFMGGSGQMPSAAAIAAARSLVGMHQVQLDAPNRTVRFTQPGVMLDLGAIGKGYAAERGAVLLREAGVPSALFHGGTSTVCAIGCPPDAPHWLIAMESPPSNLGVAEFPVLPPIPLRDESLSVSAVWGRAFHDAGKLLGHVLDPRSGYPVMSGWLAAVVLPSATETDALSTALLTLGPSGSLTLADRYENLRALLVDRTGEIVKHP